MILIAIVIAFVQAFENYEKLALERHNELRALHKTTGPLVLDGDLSAQAKKYAEHLLSLGKMVHSEADGKYGENLGWSAGRGTGDDQAVDIVQAWYDEIEDYDWSTGNSKNGKAIGHFTQLVWDDATKVGIGMAGGSHPIYGTQVYVVAVYTPPGNYRGQNMHHVQTLKSGTPTQNQPTENEPTCDVNMNYSKCGSECEPECAPDTPQCESECVAKCVCDEGYILFDGTCIKNEHCKIESEESLTDCHQKLAEAGKSKAEGEIVFVPRCGENGDWSVAQCSAATGYCWCSTPDGSEIPDTKVRGGVSCPIIVVTSECPANAHFTECGSDCEPECGLSLNNCDDTCVPKCVCNAGSILYNGACISEKYCKLEASSSTCADQLAQAGWDIANGNNAFVPNCEENGDWSIAQCSSLTGFCWCANPDGTEIENTRMQGGVSCLAPVKVPVKTERINRLPAAGSDCKIELEKSEKLVAAGNVGVFVPKCSPNGDWSLAQCSAATGYCWCSTPDGKEIPDTKSRGSVSCQISVPIIKRKDRGRRFNARGR